MSDNVTMTEGHRYKFENKTGDAILIESSDNVAKMYFTNQCYFYDTNTTKAPHVSIDLNTANTLNGPHLFLRNIGAGDTGISFDNGDTTDWSIGMDAGNPDALMFTAYVSPSMPSDYYQGLRLKKGQHDTTDDNYICLDVNPGADAAHQVGLVRTGRAGVCGTYNSYKLQSIWSIGAAYQPDYSADSEEGTLGNLYGTCYYYSGHHGLSGIGTGHTYSWVNNGTEYIKFNMSTGQSWFAGDMTLADNKDLIINSHDSGQIRILGVASGDSRDAMKIGIDGEYVGYIKFYDDDDESDQRCSIGYNASNNRFYIQQYRWSNDTWPAFYVTHEGAIYSTLAHSTSDERLKDNIQTITGSLDTIKKLRGVSYTWNSGSALPGVDDFGLIAQEVEPILPEIVTTDSHTLANSQKTTEGEIIKPYVDNQKSLNYEHLAGHFVEAIKEQQVIIEDLKARIIALENK